MNSGLNYLLDKTLGSNERLKVYYDFSPESAFIHSHVDGAQTFFSGALLNRYPSSLENDFNALISDISGVSGVVDTGDMYTDITGTFLRGGTTGDLTYSEILLTGLPNLNLHDCTFLFSSQKTVPREGLLFGSLKKVTGEYNGLPYEGSRGYNIGLNARNQLFLHGLGENGFYVLTADKLEIADKNICAISVGHDQVDFSCFQLGSTSIQNQTFYVRTENINSDIPDLINFVDEVDLDFVGDKNFNGYMDQFALFSGVVHPNECLSLASGFASDLVYTAPTVNTREIVTGQTTEIFYATGITGTAIIVTGTYQEKLSGVLKTFGFTEYNSVGIAEGGD